MCVLRVISIAALLVAAVSTAAPSTAARAYDGVLDAPVPLVRWSGVPLRRALLGANGDLDRGVVLDRRLDPSRHVDLELRNTTNRGVFEALATDAGGELRIIGETSYIGPTRSAPLRTLIRLRTDEALERFRDRPELAARRRSVAWDDYSTPRDTLTRLGEEYGVAVDGVDAIPHDLWAGAVLPDATFVEAASIVLIQFDRTFEWNEDGRGVRIVPIPKNVGLERLHTPTGETAANFAADLEKRFPEARVEVVGRRVRMFALLESHEAVASSPASRAEPDRPEPAPDLQRFTLRVKGAPASALMKRLEQAGLKFDYDADALAKAGIDLDARIEVDVKDATTTELMQAVFEPLKVDFTLDGTSVRLRARPQP